MVLSSLLRTMRSSPTLTSMTSVPLSGSVLVRTDGAGLGRSSFWRAVLSCAGRRALLRQSIQKVSVVFVIAAVLFLSDVQTAHPNIDFHGAIAGAAIVTADDDMPIAAAGAAVVERTHSDVDFQAGVVLVSI